MVNTSAGPPLVELPTTLDVRVGRVFSGIEGTSAAPTDYELSQIDILAKRIPPAAEEVRNLINVDLAALNNMIIEAKIPFIQPPTLGGAPGGGRRPPVDEDDDDPDRIDP